MRKLDWRSFKTSLLRALLLASALLLPLRLIKPMSLM